MILDWTKQRRAVFKHIVDVYQDKIQTNLNIAELTALMTLKSCGARVNQSFFIRRQC